MQNPDNLHVMAEARSLATEVFRATSQFPASERFGLGNQMRRSAISVGSNIAEGCGRAGNRELVQFLHIALGSASELEFQGRVALDVELLAATSASALLEHISRTKRMLACLIKALRARETQTSRR